MSIQSNRLSKVLDDAQIADIRKKFQALEEVLNFTVGLTVEERINLPKISVVNRTFVMDTQSALQTNGSFMPSYLNVNELGNDIVLYNQLQEFTQRSAQLSEKLGDTQMLAGSEAYVTSLAAYRLFEAAAKAGLPGADAIYDSLKERFANQGGAGTGTPAPANT